MKTKMKIGLILLAVVVLGGITIMAQKTKLYRGIFGDFDFGDKFTNEFTEPGMGPEDFNPEGEIPGLPDDAKISDKLQGVVIGGKDFDQKREVFSERKIEKLDVRRDAFRGIESGLPNSTLEDCEGLESQCLTGNRAACGRFQLECSGRGSRNVTVRVRATEPTNPFQRNDHIPNAFVSIYKITSVVSSRNYQGRFIETKRVESDGFARFRVRPGQIVNFLSWRSEINARNTPQLSWAHWSFRTPPYKNFINEDNIPNRLCQINFTDTRSKLRFNGQDICFSELDDDGIAIPTIDFLFHVSAHEMNNPTVRLPNMFINSYRVTPINSRNYNGILLDTRQTGTSSKAYAPFLVAPGEIVNFVVFRTQAEARRASRWTFNYPPYKNFAMEDGWSLQLCQTNYLDTTTKLLLSNEIESCAIAVSYIPE